MTREEHNRKFAVNRQPDDEVLCDTLGYGELSQYDGECSTCWLGFRHTWAQHDEKLAAARMAERREPRDDSGIA